MIDKETSKFIQLTSENDEMQDFQCFIRMGLKDEIKRFLNGRGVDVLNSKFFIDMRLNENLHDKDVQRDNLRTSSAKHQSIENGNIGLDEADGFIPNIQMNHLESKGFNTRLTVNAVHLAIFAQQYESLKCLLDHIFEGEIEDGRSNDDVVRDTIGGKLSLDHFGFNPDSFSFYDRCLNGMNTLHLSCHYFPEAVETIFDTIYKCLHTCPNMSEIVNDNKNILQFTPLHIAAKKSLVTASRYFKFHTIENFYSFLHRRLMLNKIMFDIFDIILDI